MTAKEPALKPISLYPSNIPKTAFPFSQWREGWQDRTIPVPGWGSRGSTLLLLPVPPLLSTLRQGQPHSCPEDGKTFASWVWSAARLGGKQALLPWQVRALWAQNPSSSHPQGPSLIVCPQPSHLTFFSPQQHFLQARDTGTLSYLLPIVHLLPPAAFLIKQATTPKPTFFPSIPPTFCLPHPLPHYPESCFCLSWLFWAGGSLGKGIQFKCCLVRMCSSHSNWVKLNW